MKAIKKTLATMLSIFMMAEVSMTGYAATDSVSITTPSQSMNGYHLDLVEDNGQYYEEILIYRNPLSRASGSYSTTYNMTGGVYTRQSWVTTAAPTFNITIEPESFAGASTEVEMGIFLEKKSSIGWSVVDEARVTLVDGGSVTLSGESAGTYRLYFRNWSGFKATGNIYVTYSY